MWWWLFSLLEKLVEIGRRVGGQQCIHRVFGHGRVHDSFGALWATRWLCVWVGERGRRGIVCVGRGFFGRGCGGGGWKYCGAASSGGIVSSEFWFWVYVDQSESAASYVNVLCSSFVA
jgi:hypothetical protein